MFADVSPSRGRATMPALQTEARQVFEEALARAAADRPAFLLERCGPNAALLRDVESLLDADAHANEGRFIDQVIEVAVQELQIKGVSVGD